MSETTDKPQLITPGTIISHALKHWSPEGARILAEGPKSRRKKQPTAAAMREQLALSANEVIRLKAVLQAQRPAGQIFAAGLVAGMLLSLLLSMLP